MEHNYWIRVDDTWSSPPRGSVTAIEDEIVNRAMRQTHMSPSSRPSTESWYGRILPRGTVITNVIEDEMGSIANRAMRARCGLPPPSSRWRDFDFLPRGPIIINDGAKAIINYPPPLPEGTEAEPGGDGDACSVCLDKAPTCLMVPCGHQCMCVPCVHECKPQKCIVCQTPLQSVIKVYKV